MIDAPTVSTEELDRFDDELCDEALDRAEQGDARLSGHLCQPKLCS